MAATGLRWDRLHDTTLVAIDLLWQSGLLMIELKPSVADVHRAEIRALRTRLLKSPRMFPWGPSVSINDVRGPQRTPDGAALRVDIEMQSGDMIVIEADDIQLKDTSTRSQGS
jgi:hypothetical protein